MYEAALCTQLKKEKDMDSPQSSLAAYKGITEKAEPDSSPRSAVKILPKSIPVVNQHEQAGNYSECCWEASP